MQIKISTKSKKSGQPETIIYRDIESEEDFEDKKIKGARAYCFYEDKFVIVYAESKGYWTPPGGGVEEGESVKDAVRREVAEETNMEVLKQRFIGLQEVIGPEKIEFFTTSVCLVEPKGSFVADPDGEITEIKPIEASEYKQYSDSRLPAIIDRLMERALEAKSEMERN